MRTRRRGFIGHLERGEFLVHAVGLLLREDGTAMEIAFVERYERSDPGLNRRGVLVEFVAVKRVTGFRAQRVPRAESGGFQAEGLTGGKQSGPEGYNCGIRTENLKTIFARVTGAGDVDFFILKMEAGDLVFLEFGRRHHLEY